MSSVEKIWPMEKDMYPKEIENIQSILTYNMSSWGLTKCWEEKMDGKHRKQLRKIWNDKNKKNVDGDWRRTYKCNMEKDRWRSFGHILRLPDETPCQKAMQYYFDRPCNAKKYPGKSDITK